MKKTTHPTVLTVTRTQISLCNSNSVSPVALKLDHVLFRDLEVVNKSEFVNKVTGFITSSQIKPSQLIIVFAPSVYFEKDLTGIPEADKAAMAQGFIDSVPLPSVSAKIFRLDGKEKLVVINRDLYDCLKESFESLKFSVEAVVPAFVTGDTTIESGLSADSCRLIFRKIDTLLENSFTASSDKLGSPRRQEQKFLKQHQSMFILISGMFVIFSVAIIVILLNRPSQAKNTSVPTSNLSTNPTIIPTLQPTPSPATTSADLANISVNILNGSGTSGLAGSIESRLKQLGFENVTTGNASTTANGTLVVFSPTVDIEIREMVLKFLQEEIKAQNVSSQENAQAQFDITITAGPLEP